MTRQKKYPAIRGKDDIIGVWYAVAAFVTWGFVPIYWKLLKQVPAELISAHRIFWAFIFLAPILTFQRRWNTFKTMLTNRRKVSVALVSTSLLSVNWFLYIWAVNTNQIIEASMGYYINPLVSVFLGVVVLRERLNFWQLVSFFMASAGVMIVTLQYGRIPWLALSLAASFGLYGLFKKMGGMDALTSLALETFLAVPVALILIIMGGWDGLAGQAQAPLLTALLFIGAGPLTALPLLWFARAAQTIKLSTVGFIQYLTPSMQLFLAVVVFKEIFTGIHLFSFGFIWCALILFYFSSSNLLSKWQPKYFQQSAGENA